MWSFTLPFILPFVFLDKIFHSSHSKKISGIPSKSILPMSIIPHYSILYYPFPLYYCISLIHVHLSESPSPLLQVSLMTILLIPNNCFTSVQQCVVQHYYGAFHLMVHICSLLPLKLHRFGCLWTLPLMSWQYYLKISPCNPFICLLQNLHWI